MVAMLKDIEDAVAAWLRWKSDDRMNEVVRISTGYVHGIISKVYNPLPNLIDRDDLIQAGMMGLLSALNRYSPSSGSHPPSWA